MSSILISTPGNESEFLESCLNMAASGFDPTLPLAFWALGRKWHINKLIYYKNLIFEAGQ